MNHMTNIRSLAVVFAILSLYALAGSAWPTSDSSPSRPATAPNVTAADDAALILADPFPARLGIAPRFGQPPTTLWLAKRECLANGTNFCFEDSPGKSCPDCGGCCSLGKEEWCCAGEGATCCPGRACCEASETCCGDGCCPRGRSCKSGKCEVPVVTVTVTSTRTVHATRTQTEVEIVTVQVNVIATSTVNSVVTTTVTSAQGTQTEITYVTSTIVVKRSLPTSTSEHHIHKRLELDIREEPSNVEARALSRFQKRLVPGGPLQRSGSNEVEPRQYTTSNGPGVRPRQNDGGTSTATVIVTTTVVGRTTVTDSRTTTDFVTSTITTTIFQSSTRVIGARETVSVISVIVITSHAPTTNTITSTSTSLIDPTGDALPPPTSSSPGTTAAPGSTDSSPPAGLSTPAMVGIGVGTGLAALILAIIALIFLRARRRRKAEGFEPDYVPAPRPAPIPLQNGDTFFGAKATSPGHSRALSSATTQVSSGRGSPEPRVGPPPDRTQRRSIPHPSTSTVGRMARFAEQEGTGPGGMG